MRLFHGGISKIFWRNHKIFCNNLDSLVSMYVYKMEATSWSHRFSRLDWPNKLKLMAKIMRRSAQLHSWPMKVYLCIIICMSPLSCNYFIPYILGFAALYVTLCITLSIWFVSCCLCHSICLSVEIICFGSIFTSMSSCDWHQN